MKYKKILFPIINEKFITKEYKKALFEKEYKKTFFEKES